MILIMLAAFLMIGAISYIYKPIYSVTLNGEFIGYSENKSKLQQKINQYIEKGNGNNIAFVDIEELPQYKLCFLKKDVPTNDEEIFNKVIEKGQTFYKYYAINVDNQEKAYVSTYEEAEKVVNELTKAYYNNLLESGVKIYEYIPGFLHAKEFISDDCKATVGTVNLDFRSLYEHFECGTYIYKNPVVQDIEKDFQVTLKKCRKVDYQYYVDLPWWYRIAGHVLRLFGPLV